MISLIQHKCKLIWYGQSTFQSIWLQMMYIGDYPKLLVNSIYIFSYNYIHNNTKWEGKKNIFSLSLGLVTLHISNMRQ